MPDAIAGCLAPAKLNLFLHVTGRRADGYHTLQTAFQLIDLADRLDFECRDDGRIVHRNQLPDVPEDTDLTVRAARLLQAEACALGRATPGVTIGIEKHIPMGGGLGGGSSDAATTLLALNHLWNLGLTRRQLMTLGLRLGADVPFFIFGTNAFAEGVGEELQAVTTPQQWFAVIHPGIAVPTPAIFSAAELTRDTKPVTILDFSAALQHSAVPPGTPGPVSTGFGHNDLEPVAAGRFPAVAAALNWLGQRGAARMSGSGACVFVPVPSASAGRGVVQALGESASGSQAWLTGSLGRHPLCEWAFRQQ